MSVDNEELVMEVAELRKDNEQLRNELGYRRQQVHDMQSREKHESESETEDADRVDEVEAQLDTRRSLEGSVRRTIALEGWSAVPNELGLHAFDIIMNLLDRQAAVTARECADNPEVVCRSCRAGQARRANTLEERNGKLHETNRKLMDELDVLRGRFDLLKLSVDSLEEERKYLRIMLDSRERELKLLKGEDEEWALVTHDSLVKMEGDSEELEKLRTRYENLKHSYARSVRDRVLSDTDDGERPVEHDTETDDPECVSLDTREKLEADIRKVAYEIYRAGGWVDNGSEPNPPTDGIRRLLDRQAALTRLECMGRQGIEKLEPNSNQSKPDLTDTRENLEADIENYYSPVNVEYWRVRDWLNRQAAITERECADKYVNTWTKGSVAWILQQYEDEKLMRDVDCEARIALETEELQDRIEELEGKVEELEAERSRLQVDTASWRASCQRVKSQRDELREQVNELANGKKAALQQLDGLIAGGYDLKAVCTWIDGQLEES